MVKALKENKNINTLIVIAIMMFIVAMIGVSYGLWQMSWAQETTNTITAKCFNNTFTDGDAINTDGMEPTTDEEGMTLDPYTFKLENTCEINVAYQVNIEILSTSTLSEEHVRLSYHTTNYIETISNYEEVDPTLGNAYKSYKIAEGVLGTGESIERSIRLWLDEATSIAEGQSKTFQAKITIITASTDREASEDISLNYCIDVLGITNLNECIKASNDIQTSIPNFNQVSSDVDTGLYKGTGTLADDYGDTYYFRGTKEALNNNVIFGGYQWKVIRINGDGSVRLIYNGTEEQFNSSNSVNIGGTNIQIKALSYNASNGNIKYVGYTYDTNTSSTIKTENELWYKNNIYDKGYDSYVSDTLFCNDRSGQRTVGATVYFSSYDRHYCTASASQCYNQVPAPTLKCTNKSDRYTTSDTVIGNGLLNQKVGLITGDESILAGGKYNTANYTYYLSTNAFWGMTSHMYFSSSASVYVIGEGVSADAINNTYGLRPVINLNSNVTIASGDGSATDPYIVE